MECKNCGELMWNPLLGKHVCKPVYHVSLYDPQEEGFDIGFGIRARSKEDAAEEFAVQLAVDKHEAKDYKIFVWDETSMTIFTANVYFEPIPYVEKQSTILFNKEKIDE